ncbi:MAG TPA: M20/M25/M40 family metallo-hydrolase, partial [Myxococcota bacterium]
MPSPKRSASLALALVLVSLSTPAWAAPLTLEQQTRATLAQLVAVDTSHGHETDALKPIADAWRASGLDAQLLESAPGRGNLIARYRGNGKKRPLLLIAHIDVVPVEGQPWTVPPFSLTDKDGYLWGRGVNDDKAMAASIVALALEVARDKPVLSRDLIFALTAGEETGGFAGAQWLAANHKDLIDAELALNEGGGQRLSDDGTHLVAVGLGAAEKTFQDYKLTVRGKGGHSSIPPTDADPVLTLAKALVKVGELRFAPHVIDAEKGELALNATLEAEPVAKALKHVVASGIVSSEDERVLAQDRIVNAHLRTTCVTTQLQGSPQDNVLPTSAEATVNCRILPDETREQTKAAIVRAIGDPLVEVEQAADFGFGPYSPLEGDVKRAVEKVSAKIWPHVPVVATLSTGTTDSRHLRAIGINSYGIGVSAVSKADSLLGHGAHGPDERRPSKWLGDG